MSHFITKRTKLASMSDDILFKSLLTAPVPEHGALCLLLSFRTCTVLRWPLLYALLLYSVHLLLSIQFGIC
ncbi:hypothetical protein BDR04DRAFT_476988 [Suillus decipiens]|nr:hypothetical protein BDR04DRAFT_476988 [Suillus decipiens]